MKRFEKNLNDSQRDFKVGGKYRKWKVFRIMENRGKGEDLKWQVRGRIL